MYKSLAILFVAALSSQARNATCETGNKATFETLAEAHQNAPAVVQTYDGNSGPPAGAPGRGPAPGAPAAVPGRGGPRIFGGHPALDNYPKGTTFVYRSPNMYGGRAAARMNTNLIVYTGQHFDTKDAALAFLKSAGLIAIADEAIGSVVLVTPIAKTFGTADAAAWYSLQTAIFAQKASGPRADGANVVYSDGEYFGGFGYTYFIGIDDGATFFHNRIAPTLDYVGRVAGALLIGGGMDEIRKIATFVPVYLVNAPEDVVARYKAANHTDAVKGRGNTVTYYNQHQPLQQVVVATAQPLDLARTIDTAYHDVLIQAMRIPVLPAGLNSAGTPYSGSSFDQAPFSLSARTAIINGKTKNGIHLIKNQGKDRFAAIKTPAGEYLDTWYEYLPEEVVNHTAPKASVPLILGNHGGGDEVRQFVDESGLLTLAGRERLAVVAADHQSLPNDVRGPALTALVKYMLATYPELDATRVYATGYSMGGGATYTVGYYDPGLFAAIAPIAGTNIEPTAAETARFANRQLPIYLSTSAYDTRRLAADTGRINDNLVNQVKRWSGWNGVPPVTFDFAAHPLSGFKGDTWNIETLNNEYASHTWYLNNAQGVPVVALNYVKDLIHALYPEYAYIAWEYMKHFSRDPKTGAIRYK